MNCRFFYLLIFAIISFSSCRKELTLSDNPSLKLSFSTDTVFFDTVFTTIGTTTKRIKIYNPAKNAINISKIDLVEETAFAKYRLNVDGYSGNHLRDIEIPANDSIFAFIEITVNPTAANLPFLISDSILFETNGNRQKVDVVAYGQNANFLRDSVLTGNIRFTNDKPDADYLLMVKPQFEVGREHLGAGGVVRDPALRKAAALDVAESAFDVGLGTLGVVASSLPGPAGNVEYFLWLRRGAGEINEADLDAAIAIGPQ